MSEPTTPDPRFPGLHEKLRFLVRSGRSGGSASSIMKPVAISLLGLALIGCANTGYRPSVVSGETIFIRGSITEDTAKEFSGALAKQKIRRVLLDSPGGGVESAIRIANLVRDNGLDVEVVGDCFSSCANYIFPAGKSKTISALGIVAWHGNISHLLYLHDIGKMPLPERDLANIKKIVAQEKAFFASIGLDEFICWFGKIEPYSVRNLYFLSAEDMSRFGLTNVSVRSDYSLTDTAPYGAHGTDIRYIKVDWSSLEHPHLPLKPDSTIEGNRPQAALAPQPSP
jgi:hypothetical protein